MKNNFSLLLLSFFSQLIFSQGFSEIGATFNIPVSYSNGEYGGGVSFVDFNQDGLDDLTFASGDGSTLRFFTNSGNGLQEIVPLVGNTEEIKQVLWVDYDNDGDLDLYLTTSGLNKLYKNTGNLEFIDITPVTGFTDPSDQSFCSSWLDYDEDGLLDLCVSHRTSHLVGHIKLYRNLGGDQFEDVTFSTGLGNLGNSVLAMTTFDMNNDGWEDIYVGQDYQQGNLMLKNNGDGTFSNISIPSFSNIENNTMTTTIGDYNNDGWMDIYLTNTIEGNSFLENQGDETFVEKASFLGIDLFYFTWGAIFLDVDNDMDLDLHVSGLGDSFIFENPGDGSAFIDRTDLWGFGNDVNISVGCASGDFNGDGRVDFSENNFNTGEHTFWRNDFTNNNYIAIKLEGTVSNSMAIGSVIDISAGGVHQVRRVACGEGFSSQNSNTQYFGLGMNSIVDEIIIKWPNGDQSIFSDIPINQKITYTEPTIEVLGCIDSISCNYNPLATMDDGSCNYPDQFYNCDGLCINDADSDGVCDELEIIGCMDMSACNFNPNATDNDSCFYAFMFYDCSNICINDMDGDGVCDELEISGCTDSTACNYNPSATDNDFSCDYIQPYLITGEPSPEMGTTLTYSYFWTMSSDYFWEINGGEIISGQGSNTIEVIWDSIGMGNLIVTEINGSGCELSVSMELNILPLSNQNLEFYQIEIYPNPVQKVLFVDLGKWEYRNTSIEIYDVLGKRIFSESCTSKIMQLNMEKINYGVYQIVLKNGKEILSTQIIK